MGEPIRVEPEPPKTQASVPPTTTKQQDIVVTRQSRISLIWEVTQAVVALMVTGATLYVAASLAVRGDGDNAAFLLLSNAFFLIVGFYFSRTNHQAIGGIGGKATDDQEYRGR